MSNPEKELQQEIQKEGENLKVFYSWLQKHMPPAFFEETPHKDVLLIARNLMSFPLQNYFLNIYLEQKCFSLCLESSDADLKILSTHQTRGIRSYRSFVSNAPLPFPKAEHLKIAALTFTTHEKEDGDLAPSFEKDEIQPLFLQLQKLNPTISEKDFVELIKNLPHRFMRSLNSQRLVIALNMLFKAQTRDSCQYVAKNNQDWEKTKSPSLQIVFAWRNVPKYRFLYRLAQIIHRHKLALTKVNASYIKQPSGQNILLMSLGIHGIHGKAAWEEADIEDFLQELVTVKYFEGLEEIDTTFVNTYLIRGNLGNFLKAMIYFIHQTLVHMDINAYSFRHIKDGICRHPKLACLLTQAFEYKFHPKKNDLASYEETLKTFLDLVNKLDTGNELHDTLNKNILKQGCYFIDFLLKTNFYQTNKTAFSFRLDPKYLDHLPFERKEKFPELPFAIYFMKGFHFLGFHIRFKDLSRGGLRTVVPERQEKMIQERNNVFSECYNLAYTQQKKNKDIPEGGAKGVVFLEPFDRLSFEMDIFSQEMHAAKLSPETIQKNLDHFLSHHKKEHIHQAQRSYIESFMTLINCNEDGILKAKNVVDYLKKPEYIYLGPDENMHNETIEWIAEYSVRHGYKPGNAFISSKESLGINHKEFGVTSLGVHVYTEEVLKYLGIDPYSQPFTIKMSGGPDGDVAGNQMLNFSHFHPKTAKLLTTIDVSGTIFDPQGLDLQELRKLFLEQKPICFYPPEKLSDGGFLLNTRNKREESSYTFQTLLIKKEKGKLVEEWLSGNEMNHLLRMTVLQTQADIFIPGGGRPRTLNESNIKDFLTHSGIPSSRAIIEGANLYLTPFARRYLEDLGVLIIKDSSSNKGGVICSSFEVLCCLCLKPEEFLKEKPKLVEEIIQIIRKKAFDEARLLLTTHAKTGRYLTDISEEISCKINSYMYQLLDYLEGTALSEDPKDPLNTALLMYSPPTLRTSYPERIFKEIPDVHKKAIIACHIASNLVYKRGVDWSPNIIDVLPLISKDPEIIN